MCEIIDDSGAVHTVCIDDSGAVGSDFWDRKFAEYMNWEIDHSQTESIVMADPSKAFKTEGETIGRPPLELVTSDKRLVRVAVPANGSVANLSSSSKGTRAGKGPVSYTHLTLPTIYSV